LAAVVDVTVHAAATFDAIIVDTTTYILNRAIIDASALSLLLLVDAWAVVQRLLVAFVAVTEVIVERNTRGRFLVLAFAVVSAIVHQAVIDVDAIWSGAELSICLARDTILVGSGFPGIIVGNRRVAAVTLVL
jgi:hypothetical protein